MHNGELRVEHWFLFDYVQARLVPAVLHLVFAVLVLWYENGGVTLLELCPVRFEINLGGVLRGMLVHFIHSDYVGLRHAWDDLPGSLLKHLLLELSQCMHLTVRCIAALCEYSIRLDGLLRSLNHEHAPFLLLPNTAESRARINNLELGALI